MSAAKAIGDHLRDWICGSNGRWVSMAVNSTGNSYNIPEGLIYSFPVTCEGKIFKIPEHNILKGITDGRKSLALRQNPKTRQI